mmetsp:Transcript_46533/g.129285  ORF Transcript_46533/g.129285 Transcript_46533/m.129285 type:complete len:202 (+) Transcript_46533:1280-1885(+)
MRPSLCELPRILQRAWDMPQRHLRLCRRVDRGGVRAARRALPWRLQWARQLRWHSHRFRRKVRVRAWLARRALRDGRAVATEVPPELLRPRPLRRDRSLRLPAWLLWRRLRGTGGADVPDGLLRPRPVPVEVHKDRPVAVRLPHRWPARSTSERGALLCVRSVLARRRLLHAVAASALPTEVLRPRYLQRGEVRVRIGLGG